MNINTKTISNYTLPPLIGGGIDCLLDPTMMKNFIGKSYAEIESEILIEINKIKNNNIDGISISIPNLGNNEEESICKILKLSHIYTDLIWLINVSHSPLSVVKKALSCVQGIPVVNFTTLETPRCKEIFQIIKEINGIIIIQLIDENGLPHSINERVKLIEKLNKEIIHFGLKKENVVVDILTPPLGTINDGMKLVIETIKLLKTNKFKTITWLNNISVGWQNRQEIDILYATMLLSYGIDSIVLNTNQKSFKNIIEISKNLNNKGI